MPNPILKPSVRMKKYTDRVLVMENLSGYQRRILPVEAMLLTLLTGENSKEELTAAIGSFLGYDQEQAAKFTEKTFEKLAPCIDMEGKSKFVPRYEPEAFIYEVDLNAKPPRHYETPSEMLLSLTHKCNFRCVYCFNGSADCVQNELSTEEWLAVVRQMDEMGVLRAVVSGGEPTMHPGYIEIVRELKRRGILIDFCTNGSVISEELLDLLEGENVQFSLDAGDPDMFKRLTGGIDAFSTVTENMRRVTRRGIPLRIKAVMTSWNTDNVAALYNICAECGVTRLGLAKFELSSGGREDNAMQEQLALSEEQKASLQAQIEAAKKANPSSMRAGASLSCDIWREKNDIVTCGAFTQTMIIQPNGDLSLCERMPDVPEMLFGNVRENALVELWNQPRIVEFFKKRDETPDPKCSKCAYLNGCQTGCFAIKYFRGMRGDALYLRDPRCIIDVEKSEKDTAAKEPPPKQAAAVSEDELDKVSGGDSCYIDSSCWFDSSCWTDADKTGTRKPCLKVATAE